LVEFTLKVVGVALAGSGSIAGGKTIAEGDNHGAAVVGIGWRRGRLSVLGGEIGLGGGFFGRRAGRRSCVASTESDGEDWQKA
jgi:hypothetical protein